MRGFNKKEPKSRRAGGRDVQRIQDWCLRTYGDSGKTKTCDAPKIQQNHADPATERGFRRSLCRQQPHQRQIQILGEVQGFQVGSNILGEHNKKEPSGKPVLYVPVKSTVKCFFQLIICEWTVSLCVCVFMWLWDFNSQYGSADAGALSQYASGQRSFDSTYAQPTLLCATFQSYTSGWPSIFIPHPNRAEQSYSESWLP